MTLFARVLREAPEKLVESFLDTKSKPPQRYKALCSHLGTFYSYYIVFQFETELAIKEFCPHFCDTASSFEIESMFGL
jgi:hypothetical protein